jgi:hypothetical protein
MRFSSVFQLAAVPQNPAAPVREAAPADGASETPAQPAAASPPAPVPGQDLPEDLDARVRLIGEWQLGEGY